MDRAKKVGILAAIGGAIVGAGIAVAVIFGAKKAKKELPKLKAKVKSLKRKAAAKKAGKKRPAKKGKKRK